MVKTTVFWDRADPKVSGYYLTTWGPTRTVSKMFYSTDYGWTHGKPVGSGNYTNYGKKVTDVLAWAYLPDPCAR